MSDKPRLLVMASTYPRWAGDPEPGFVHSLNMRLSRAFDVVVVAPHAPGAARHEMMDGVAVHRFRYAPERLELLVNDGGIIGNLRRNRGLFLLVPFFLAGSALAAWRIARTWKPDIIHAHWLLPQGILAVLLARFLRHRVAVMVTGHGSDVLALDSRLARWLRCYVLHRTDSATVVGCALRERLLRECPGADTALVRPMGVDVSGKFVPSTAEVRSRFVILHAGRLVRGKGARHVIDAMPAILAKFPDATLEIAGFGPEEPALRAQVAALGLAGAVTFLGPVPNDSLPALYRRAAVLAAPFEAGAEEGLGLVMVEAAACGCHVVAGDITGAREILGDGTVGTLVPAGNPAALADAICAVLASPPSMAREAERVRAMERFDWTACAEAYKDALLAILPRP